jgi:hypothetical protein
MKEERMYWKIMFLAVFAIIAVSCAPTAVPAPTSQPVEAGPTPIPGGPVLPGELLARPLIGELFVPGELLANQCWPPKMQVSAPVACDALPSYKYLNDDSLSSTVAILVVDDFGSQPLWQLGIPLKVDIAPEQAKFLIQPPDPDDDCLMRPDGQAHFASEGSANEALPVPHGELVYTKLDWLLQESGFANTAYEGSDQCWKRMVGLYEDEKGRQVLLVGVDTQNYNTQVVSTNIEAAISALAAGPVYVGGYEVPPADRIIINMSFAIIPCEALMTKSPDLDTVLKLRDELQGLQGQVQDFDPALEALVQSLDAETMELQAIPTPLPLETGQFQPGEPLKPVLAEATFGSSEASELLGPAQVLAMHPRFFNMYEPYETVQDAQEYLGDLKAHFQTDVLYQLLACYANRDLYHNSVISVASAGNFRSYPYPFAPALFDSVLSISADYSYLPEGACKNKADRGVGSNGGEIRMGAWVEYGDQCYLGTSFAAPWMSWSIAQKMLDHGPEWRPCAGNLNVYPPYSIADESGTWDNILFEDDIASYCPEDLAVLATPPTLPGGPAAQGDVMQSGEVLYPGQWISSLNGRYQLIYQWDGNLVLYDGASPLWASGTYGSPAGVCIMQEDGNLVIYIPDNQPIWASNTDGYPGSKLIVQDDGNVVIYTPEGAPLWATNTVQP